MSQAEADAGGDRGTDEGGKLKESGTTHWNQPNEGATNESGFSALPGGYRHDYGPFRFMGIYATFWSSTDADGYSAWYRFLSYGSSQVVRYGDSKLHGFSVRCVKGESSHSVPTVTTAAVSAITESSADCGGNVTSDGAPV